MTPYYDHGGITIYRGDCREVLPSLNVSVDCIVADPPYGETSLCWDSQVSGWLDSAAKATRSLWCFGSLQMFMDMARERQIGQWRRSQEIVWEKHNGSNFHADRFRRVHELAVHFYMGKWADIWKHPVKTPTATARTIRRKERPAHTGHIDASTYVSHDGGPALMRSVIYARSCHGEAQHPTQKPTAIINPLLRYSVPVGGLVLDPFVGSGSTLIAARTLGCRAIGIEIEEKYCAIAAKRLTQEVFEFDQTSAPESAT
jgi:site-specific DNA-methyltransferase (adenine-specific)